MPAGVPIKFETLLNTILHKKYSAQMCNIKPNNIYL
jgi:hypothetical protein